MENKIYGKNPVLEALNSDISFNKILIAKDIHKDKKISKIISLAKEKGIVLRFVDKKIIDDEVKDNTQGVLGYISEIKYYEWDEIENVIDKKKDFIVILDHVQDPHNLGSAIRTCEFGGAKAVVIPKDRASQVTSTVYKTSSGAVSYIPIVRATNINQFIRKLKESGWYIVGADLDTDNLYSEVDYKFPLALVIGGEEGLHRLVRESCDILVKIPKFGKVESLNLSVALGILIYKIREKI
ncbi:MAG: 23S rRNA (guanosine(2251)-2'-O)-methyltransferase RlmB [Dictyoglomus sp. NZ13-RE01]|nr:MAG: 23S rRNA (guanosine(2251)-2'-O)-methyltransferase RlmB [Dictyoglomus sp. NZ13-RE01]